MTDSTTDIIARAAFGPFVNGDPAPYYVTKAQAVEQALDEAGLVVVPKTKYTALSAVVLAYKGEKRDG